MYIVYICNVSFVDFFVKHVVKRDLRKEKSGREKKWGKFWILVGGSFEYEAVSVNSYGGPGPFIEFLKRLNGFVKYIKTSIYITALDIIESLNIIYSHGLNVNKGSLVCYKP